MFTRGFLRGPEFAVEDLDGALRPGYAQLVRYPVGHGHLSLLSVPRFGILRSCASPCVARVSGCGFGFVPDALCFHPRGRGAAFDGVRSAHSALGSSPCVRGCGHRAAVPVEASGLIPALAGRGCHPVWMSPCKRVHPRPRGGAALRSCMPGPIVVGSSPRVRGSLALPDRYERVWGSIPPCAGKPRRRRGRRAADGVHPRCCGETGQGPADGAGAYSEHVRRRFPSKWVTDSESKRIIPGRNGSTSYRSGSTGSRILNVRRSPARGILRNVELMVTRVGGRARPARGRQY